jgi:hypothetical protein
MIRLVNIDDIHLYHYELDYQLKRKYMTEKERIEDDEYVKASIAEFENMRLKFIRNKRDELLAKTDHYTLPDIKISDDKRSEIMKYRQKLRDFPNKIINAPYGDEFHLHILTTDRILELLQNL